jgi:hypothetical protein
MYGLTQSEVARQAQTYKQGRSKKKNLRDEAFKNNLNYLWVFCLSPRRATLIHAP